MSDLFDEIGQTLADLLGLPAVGIAGRVAIVVLVVLWVAAAWWTWTDAGTRSDDPLVRGLATAGVVLATPLLFPLAIVLYLLLRPRSRPGGEHQLELRLLAMGGDTEPDRCPACSSVVSAGWRRCPACGERLSSPCPACDRPARSDWAICAWCAAELPWAAEVAAAAADATPDPVAIPVVPGGRGWLPVMAVPEPGEAEAPEGVGEQLVAAGETADAGRPVEAGPVEADPVAPPPRRT